MNEKPWVGKLHQDREEFADWGWIRDESGALIFTVNFPVDADLKKHRRDKTDPTQARVDAIVEAVNERDALRTELASTQRRLAEALSSEHHLRGSVEFLVRKTGDEFVRWNQDGSYTKRSATAPAAESAKREGGPCGTCAKNHMPIMRNGTVFCRAEGKYKGSDHVNACYSPKPSQPITNTK